MSNDEIAEIILIEVSRTQRLSLMVAVYGDIIVRQMLAAQAYRYAREAFEAGDYWSAIFWQHQAARESKVYLTTEN